MARLIDADDLIEEIHKNFDNFCVLSKMEYVIGNQPTVFDVENVVAELEQQAEQYRERGFETERKNVKVMVTMADRYYAKQCSYLNAIDIVKRGGVDER